MRELRRILVVVALASLAALLPATSTMAESTGSALVGNVADYYGTKIDLSAGWGGAEACVVFSKSDVRCYRSSAEADMASTGQMTTEASVQGTANCPAGWVCIYEHPNWDGRRLQFSDEYWQSLAPYGFERQASSWHNNQDCRWWQSKSDTAALGNGVVGLTLPACANSSQLGPWDNVAVDIHG